MNYRSLGRDDRLRGCRAFVASRAIYRLTGLYMAGARASESAGPLRNAKCHGGFQDTPTAPDVDGFELDRNYA
jgi:hypothetical protein